MWHKTLERISELKALDNNLTVYGAIQHQYAFSPPVTLDRILAYEEQIGVELPIELRTFYLEVGDGGVGPDSGILPLDDIIPYRPEQEWKGCDHPDYNDDVDDFAYETFLTGLISIMDRFYHHESCIVTRGEAPGQLIAVSGNFIFIEADSLIEEYNSWLDKHLSLYGQIKNLILAGQEIYEIAKTLEQERDTVPENALTYTASVLDFPFAYHPDAMEARRWIYDEHGKIKDFAIDEAVQLMFNGRMQQYVATYR